MLGGQRSRRAECGVLKAEEEGVSRREWSVCQILPISHVTEAGELTFRHGLVEAIGGFDKNQFSTVL